MLTKIYSEPMVKVSKKFICICALFNIIMVNANANESVILRKSKYEESNKINFLNKNTELIVKNKSRKQDFVQKFDRPKKKKIKLTDLENIIKYNSDDLKIMESRIEEARLLLKSEISSRYPNLNLSSTGFPQYITGNTSNKFSTNTSSSQTKAGLKATLKWDLINPSKVAEISAARDNFENARIAYSIKYLDLLLEAQSQFFKLQQSLQDIRIAKDSLKTSSISLKEASVKLNSGLGSKFDLLEAKTKLSKDKQLLIEKLGARKINERKLIKLLNFKSNIIPIVDSMPKIIGLWDISLEESINSGYKYRQELDQILLEISIKNNEANQAIGYLKPTLSLYNIIDGSLAEGEIGVTSPRGNNNINSLTNTVGLQFEWPIFDGGSSKARYDAKKEKIKEIKAEFSLKKAQIKNEIEETFIEMNVAKENIKNSNDAIQSAKESLRLSLLRLKAGITTQREVFDNQRDLTDAEVKHIQAITEYNQNIIKLQRKTGINEFKECTQEEQSDVSLNNNKTPSSSALTYEKCMELL